MTLEEKLAQLGSFWAFELFRSEAELDPSASATRSPTASARSARRGRDEPRPDRRRRGRQRDPALPRRGDAARIPALLHEESLHGLLARDAPSTSSRSAPPRRSIRSSSRRSRPRSAAGCGRSGRPWRWRRSSTSAATRAGAASRRRTARTRTSRPSWARPTSAGSRARTCDRRRRDRPSTSPATASPRAGSTRPRPTSARASCARSSCCRSRPPSGAPESRASCPPTATSTACPATSRASC